MPAPLNIASLFSQSPSRASYEVRFRQGVILAWNPLTLENQIDVDGVTLEDLPVLGVAEAASYSVGDVVGLHLMCGVGTQNDKRRNAQTWAIIGQIVTPGTQQAEDAISQLADRVQADFVLGTLNTASLSFVDLGGPSVTTAIGPSGKALVWTMCTFNYGTDSGAGQSAGGHMSFAVSGASTVAADSDFGPTSFFSDNTGTTTIVDRKSGIWLVEGLTPGSNTFSARYAAAFVAVTCNFSSSLIAVMAL